jgi:hypothetical protein
MLYSRARMPVVFVVANDWTLRSAIRAELRHLGIAALGMDIPDDVGRAIAADEMPAVIVVEGTAPLALHPAIQNLMRTVPAILIASRTETVPLPLVTRVFYRPVRIGEIVAAVRESLQGGQCA